MLLLLLLLKQGQLPGKAVQNPKEQCKVISLKKAPGVQIDQPEVQATTIAIHTSPVELAQQARSAARSSHSSSIESDISPQTDFA
ncbi:unnamed protein product [Microthlaspi erraticum]|uniref:SMP domain-containing protein n=1 Tax=Microthlaspi erraticum TaxID=1685480 RepID=A0A6D2HKK1_9BRAS|nr:unnamed protein product [Microthlaspi erraticum]